MKDFFIEWKKRNRAKIEEWMLTLKFIKRMPLTIIGLTLVFMFIFVSLFGGFIKPYDPYKLDLSNALKPPSFKHPFGTDEYGRDILSRVLVGSWISFEVSVITLSIAVSLGIVIGLISGYFGGLIDETLMRITDIFLAFPGLVLAMAFSVALGTGLKSVMIALAIVWWPSYSRVVRGQVLSVKENLYVEAAKAIGLSNFTIMFKHILPNILSPVLVLATLDMGGVILTAAALSFIGLGAQPPTPEWGRLIADGQPYFPEYWWYVFFPGMAIFFTVLGFNLVGDGITEALDPRLRRKAEFGVKNG